jgi:hypothetical protein
MGASERIVDLPFVEQNIGLFLLTMTSMLTFISQYTFLR